MAQTVIGIFDDASEAQTAMQELMEAGFSRNNIDLSTSDNSTMADSSYITRTDVDVDRDTDRNRDKGGISGFFASLFGDDDDDRDRYTTVGERHSILTVHAQSEDEAERAADILDDAGAIDVNERAEQYRSGSYATNSVSGEGYATGSGLNTGVTADPLAPAYGATMGVTTDTTDYTNRDRDVTDRDYTTRDTSLDYTPNTDENTTVKVLDEQLNVGKRTEERGGVRLRSRIVERPVEEHLRLREERVNVQRNPVNRPATEADFTAFNEGQVEMVEHAEVPVVNKAARVVEEVSLNKDVTERDETIRDTVRHTDVEVENISGTTTAYNRNADYDRTVDPESDVTNR